MALPGKNPMLYYLCVGKMPASLIKENFKGNPSVNLLALVTFLSLLYTSVRYSVWKFKEENKSKLESMSIQGYLKQEMVDESVFV